MSRVSPKREPLRRDRLKTGPALRAHAKIVWKRLSERYPNARCALDHRDPYQLLVATILSAQCTDRRVNMVTPALFERYPDARALAAARQEDIEGIIRSTGFFRAKARNLIGMAHGVVERHSNAIPDEMASLTALPGVGRKTANVVLGNAFGKDEGVVVDTHVERVSRRLGLTRESDPVKIEQDLMKLFPRDQWTMLSHLMIEHGRNICVARNPQCGDCPLSERCPASRV